MDRGDVEFLLLGLGLMLVFALLVWGMVVNASGHRQRIANAWSAVAVNLQMSTRTATGVAGNLDGVDVRAHNERGEVWVTARGVEPVDCEVLLQPRDVGDPETTDPVLQRYAVTVIDGDVRRLFDDVTRCAIGELAVARISYMRGELTVVWAALDLDVQTLGRAVRAASAICGSRARGYRS